MTFLDSAGHVNADLTVERVLGAYFDTINAADFEATAALFAGDGTLYPPYGCSVTGREAIATYLAKEAVGMRLCPDFGQLMPLDDRETLRQTFRIAGTVQTSFFTVKVKWKFTLNSAYEIVAVRVNLLASLEELLNISSHANLEGEAISHHPSQV